MCTCVCTCVCVQIHVRNWLASLMDFLWAGPMKSPESLWVAGGGLDPSRGDPMCLAASPATSLLWGARGICSPPKRCCCPYWSVSIPAASTLPWRPPTSEAAFPPLHPWPLVATTRPAATTRPKPSDLTSAAGFMFDAYLTQELI